MHALQHSLPLFPLAAQAVCFCGPMSPLYLSVITLELSDPKTRGSLRVCQRRWLPGRRRPVLLSSLLLSIDQPRLGLDGPAQAVCPRGRCACRSPQLTFRLPPYPAWRAASQPLSNAASQGLSTVLMRISLFVLFMCVTLILLAISCFTGSRNNLCVAQVGLDGTLGGWSLHTQRVV